MHKANSKYIIYAFLLSLASAWLIGFACFVYNIQQQRLPCVCNAEVIVVLTGGQERILAGGNLLAQNKDRLLLLSGTGKGFAKQNFFMALPVNSAARHIDANNLFLGAYAKNTVENAYEALAFMKMHNKHSLCLVTSDYHMPRSLLLFKFILPQYSIAPCALTSAHNFTLWQFAKVALLEYTKHVYTVVQNLLVVS